MGIINDFLSGWMAPLEKLMLEKQIDVYLDWGRRRNIGSIGYKEFLNLFLANTTRTDVLDMTNDDVAMFIGLARQTYASKHYQESARRAIEGLVRFYDARGKNGLKTGKMGRPPHLNEIEQVQKYRNLGLKLREISRLTGKDLSQVHRWIKFPLDLFK